MQLFSRCRCLNLYWILVVLVLLTVSAVPCLAVPINFSASGSQVTALEADVPLRSIGGLLLTKGSVSISGNTIEVNAVPDWLFDPHAVLSGVVINSEMQNKGEQTIVSGLVYFSGGDWLPNLSRGRALDVVTSVSGTAISGRIQRTTENSLEIQLIDGTRKSIPFKDIADLTSGKAFNFELPSTKLKIQPDNSTYEADAATISFKPSTTRGVLNFVARRPEAPASRLPGAEGGVKNSTIATMVAADIANMIAPAIAAPLIYRGPSLLDKQLLHGNGNVSDSLPYYAPQIYANGKYVPYPFTGNTAVDTAITNTGIAQGNPLF